MLSKSLRISHQYVKFKDLNKKKLSYIVHTKQSGGFPN